MVSKNQIKLITGLHQKKYREREGLFIAEGIKVIGELLKSQFELEHLFETEPLFPKVSPDKKTTATQADLKKMSALTTANNCLAVFRIPDEKPIDESGLIVALDDIRDPGNLGTILRLCDWFGVRQVVCSNETADLYNPKVVQATMGSLARVNVSYLDLTKFLSKIKLPVFGTFMDGKNIYSEKLPTDGVIIMGNEANGISAEVEKFVTSRIAIPQFGEIRETESLNVATATAVVLSEFRRGA
ncbi:MAG: RNA methyltransferase [Flavobacterium sp.]|uniref:TrmH family RNA methyltransferase n=1 Tax=Flavobacterium sp. TaxID=239 RepID=UPI0011F9357C|nr:RNA methyltransferase [Flavobacterium sp.]RZJ64552.1 MAG: RNA methyltransferase [Flavobacterium sp.]